MLPTDFEYVVELLISLQSWTSTWNFSPYTFTPSKANFYANQHRESNPTLDKSLQCMNILDLPSMLFVAKGIAIGPNIGLKVNILANAAIF